MKNQDLKRHYDQVYRKDSKNYYTFSSYEESQNILRLLNDINGKKIIEIGCGEGNLCSMMAMAGGIITGIDYSHDAIEIAKSRHNLNNLNFVRNDYRKINDNFDIVIMQGTLEHLDDPFGELKWIMTNILNDKGYVITSSPSFINPRGYIWMTLQLLFDVPMSLSDLHFLCPFDFKAFCN